MRKRVHPPTLCAWTQRCEVESKISTGATECACVFAPGASDSWAANTISSHTCRMRVHSLHRSLTSQMVTFALAAPRINIKNTLSSQRADLLREQLQHREIGHANIISSLETCFSQKTSRKVSICFEVSCSFYFIPCSMTIFVSSFCDKINFSRVPKLFFMKRILQITLALSAYINSIAMWIEKSSSGRIRIIYLN
jgi:hypothetical protein